MVPARNLELLHKHQIAIENTLAIRDPLVGLGKTNFSEDNNWYNLLQKTHWEDNNTSSINFDLYEYQQKGLKNLELNIIPTQTCLSTTNTQIPTYNVTDNPTIKYEQLSSASVHSKINETILEWWSGKVIDISYDEKYFTADMTDSKGDNSIIELDFHSAFQSEKDIKLNLFKGARLTFCVFTKHQPWGAPQLTSQVEFVPPYIWREVDNEKVEKAIGKLFPEELKFDN